MSETKRKKKLTDDDISNLRLKIKPYYTEKRYAHTLSVEKEAVKIGEIYLPGRINELRASALLHDITKNADLKKQLQYCEEFGIIVKSEDELSPAVFHAKTAAAVAARDFSAYTNDDIISGIRWHTTGRDGMTLFDAIIYLADYIEETRTFDDCVKLRNYFYNQLSSGEDKHRVLTDTLIYSFDMTISMLVRDGAIVDNDTVSARNYFIASKKKNSLKVER